MEYLDGVKLPSDREYGVTGMKKSIMATSILNNLSAYTLDIKSFISNSDNIKITTIDELAALVLLIKHHDLKGAEILINQLDGDLMELGIAMYYNADIKLVHRLLQELYTLTPQKEADKLIIKFGRQLLDSTDHASKIVLDDLMSELSKVNRYALMAKINEKE